MSSNSNTPLYPCIAILLALVIGGFAWAQTPPLPAEQEPSANLTPDTTPADADDESELTYSSKPGTFEFHVKDTPLQQVFRMLGEEGRKNIIATKEVTGKVSADLVDVTFREALEAVLRSTGYVYEESGGFIYVMTPEQKLRMMEANRKVGIKTFHLAYVTANDAKAFVAPAMSKDGMIAFSPSAANGISASPTEAGGNSYATDDLLVIRDYEDNLERIAQIIQEIDVKPEQVLIEATILRATLNETNALGVDIGSLSGIDFETLQSDNIQGVLLDPKTVPLTPGMTPSNAVYTDFAAAVPAGGATFGFISDQVSVFVRALETVTDTTVLANPKLLVVNKQRGEVMIGNRDGYLTTTVTETVATQTVQFLETGTRLVVRPFIGRNGYVRLELHPEDSFGSVKTVGTSVLPSESTTEVTSNVLVRDGHTIVIGGLFRERTANARSQVPLLGNIPCVGAAFRSTNDTIDREEMIILITPRIIKQAQDEATSDQLKDDAERFRVGQRKGLQWWGRGRLAQAHMRMARSAVECGHDTVAQCHVDMALSLEPRMLDAIRFKEQLTDKAYWSDEYRSTSVKYTIEKMIAQEIGMPVDRVIPPCKPLDSNRIDPDYRKMTGIEQEYRDPLHINAACGPYPAGYPAKDPNFKNDPRGDAGLTGEATSRPVNFAPAPAESTAVTVVETVVVDPGAAEPTAYEEAATQPAATEPATEPEATTPPGEEEEAQEEEEAEEVTTQPGDESASTQPATEVPDTQPV